MGRDPGIGSRQLICPNTDTDHSDQSVPVPFAPLFLEGRDPGTGRGRSAVRASARAGRAALRGRVRGIGPAGVRGRTAELPAGHRAGVGLPQRDRVGATRSWSGSSHFGALLDEAVGGLGRLVPDTHPSSVPLGS